MKNSKSNLPQAQTSFTGWFMGTVGRSVGFFTILATLFSTFLGGCTDRVNTTPNPTSPTGSFNVRPLTVKLFANQSVRISIPDSLQLQTRTFTLRYGTTGLGTLTFDSVSQQPALVFIPKADTIGAEDIIYTVCSNGVCKSSTIRLEIRDINACTLKARPPFTLTLVGDSNILDLAQGAELCGNQATFAISYKPAHVNAAFSGSTLQLSSTSQTSFNDSLVYTIAQPRKLTVKGRIDLVEVINCLVARNDYFQIRQGGLSVLNILANDNTCNGQPVNIVIDRQPRSGTLNVVGGQVNYQHNISTTGNADSFVYHLENGSMRSAQATVTLDIRQACSSAVPPFGFYKRDILVLNQDSFSLRRLITGFNNYTYCQGAVFTLTSLLNQGQNQVSIQSDGQVVVNALSTTTISNPMRINFSVRDSSGRVVNSDISINVMPRTSICAFNQLQLPQVQIIEQGLNPIILDLYALARQTNPNQCTMLFSGNSPNGGITWLSTLPAGLIRTNIGGQPNQFAFRLANGIARPFTTTLNYKIDIVNLNGFVVGSALGSINLQFR